MEPLLKWVGSKRWHVPQVAKLWHGGRVVELFAGSCAMSFGLQPAEALLNDLNPHLINFYRWVQAKLGQVWDLDLMSDERTFYANRIWFNDLTASAAWNSFESAQLFYYLNRHGFNNLCRFNKAGDFNVPWRKRSDALWFDADVYRDAVRGWQFSNDDFRDVPLRADDFVYADPPYDSTFTGYTGAGFTFDLQQTLAQTLRAHSGRVILMNAATPRILDLYRELGYYVTLLPSSQQMHRSRGRTDVVHEVMATNFPVDCAQDAGDHQSLKVTT